jgi:hypothetical protein
MWADNETYVDLLGFEFLVDELELLLSEKRLLPVTVLVDGDWGSGKSSLMQMTQDRLEAPANEDRFICVSFTPWRFEDFGYAKVALMAAVIDAISDFTEGKEDGRFQDVRKKASRLRRKLNSFGALTVATTIGGTLAGLGPEETKMAGDAAAVFDKAGAASAAEEAPEQVREFETVAHFHHEFEELVDSLGDDLQAVVVFLDDMDRCSTETIVQTFEAMRLFLHADKTAYVVGAHREMVEAALEGRYPSQREGDENLGRNYLEKMLQNTISVPPLSQPEAQTYINLLFCELGTSEEQFKKLCDVASATRASNQLSVAMNAGIAAGAIGELDEDLAAKLDLAEAVGPALAQGLRGNPRQIKRFLNRLLLRQRTAEKRGLKLELPVLAKMMILDELHPRHFEQLFRWHLDTESGTVTQLHDAEKLARGEKPKDVDASISQWVVQPGVRDWLELTPPLSNLSLSPYFSFSRTRLAHLVTGARLSPELQALLAQLLNGAVDPIRVKAVGEAENLDADEIGRLLPALLEAAERDPGGAAGSSLVELAARRAEVATAMFDQLDIAAPRKLTGNFILRLGGHFRGDARLLELAQKWADKGSGDVKKQAERVLDKR